MRINNNTPISASVYADLAPWVQEHIHDPIIRRHKVSKYSTEIDPTLTPIRYTSSLTDIVFMKPMFESLLRSRLQIALPQDMIEKVMKPRVDMELIPTHYHADNLIIDYLGLVKQYRIDLGGYDGRSLLRQDSQAGRVKIIRKYMRLMGFKLVHDLMRLNKKFDLNFKTVQEHFWIHYISLNPRDRDYKRPVDSSVFKFGHEELGVRPEYFDNYTRGVNIGLSFVSFIQYISPNFIHNNYYRERTFDQVLLQDNQTTAPVYYSELHMSSEKVIHDSSFDELDDIETY